MDANAIFKRVQQMRPSSLSEEERCRYQAEKMMLRQFMLLKQQDQVPDHLTVQQMKTWLLTGGSFVEESQEITIMNDDGRLETKHLLMAELAWTTERRFCLSQIEQEVQEELDEEKRLSQLLNRKVTLEGLQMFVTVFRPKAEKAVRTYLPSLFSKLLKYFGGSHIPPVSSGDAKPQELLDLQKSTAPVIQEVINTTLKFLLEEPKSAGQIEAASVEVGRLLRDSAAPCLPRYGPLSAAPLLGVCTIAAGFMVKSIFKEFDRYSQKIFHIMDYDDSFFSARENVIFAIQDMENRVQAAACRPQPQLSTAVGSQEGPLEEKTASPEVSLDETSAVRTSSSSRLETNVIVYMEPELEVLQEELEAEDFGVQRKMKRKKRVRAFFHGIWRAMSRCFHCPSED
ncbi:uncharacterized protein LOC121885859 [Thunnus maccoyii]|uniref:uncharacterized protein LOC121885859 n=1 Tax=Thunnus maccoyii TaxID=8240 RepID=UPI001C4DB119|nr:uncharacterized protein LOC121885859 [Thunnus maccoyii]